MDKIGLFGGGGFIGSHLARRLVEEGHEVIVVDITSEKIEDIVSHERVEFYELDITDSANDGVCLDIVNEADVVVDLVAYANPQQYLEIPLDVVDLNYHQNMSIVEDCVETDTRLVQFSTCEVYGKLGNRTGDDVEFSEDASNLVMGPIGQQRWIYASAKELLERMVYAHGEENGLDWTIIRPFNFIGPEMDYIITSPEEGTPRVFAAFMSSLLYDHSMYLVNGGTNRRVFTYIEDAIDAIVLTLENEDGQFSREIVNVGTCENEVTIREFAEIMRDVYREKTGEQDLPELRDVSGEEFYGEGYEDSERRVPDTTKLHRAGWDPKYDLREALSKAIDYYIRKYKQTDHLSA